MTIDKLLQYACQGAYYYYCQAEDDVENNPGDAKLEETRKQLWQDFRKLADMCDALDKEVEEC